MGENTAISWTNRTWNPWHGCIKVSPGCLNCYMYRDKARYGQNPMMVVRSKTTFNDPLKWKDPCLCFTCSWSDFFIKEADAWRSDAWEIIRRTPHITYQILTKRTDNIAERLPDDWGAGYPNVWLGFSAENQEYFEKRASAVLAQDGLWRKAKWFVSCEPLLGAIDFKFALGWISWVIVGGESGKGFRPINLDHAKKLRDQCVSAGVPFFFKQVGGNQPTSGGDLLDGEQWHQMPEIAVK